MERDTVALEELGDGSKVVEDVLRSGRPKAITQHGVTVAAIVNAEAYESMLADAAAALVRDLQAAADEADAGLLIDHADLMAQVKRRFEGKVPAALLNQLDTA